MTSNHFKLYFDVHLGIDQLAANRFEALAGMHVGLCTSIAACDRCLRPTIDIFSQQRKFTLKIVLAPEHGLYGALQDQKKTGDAYYRKHRVPIHSIYGKRIMPSLSILKDLDIVVIDLLDIGARYYTFLWSALLIIAQLAKLKKKVVILDRPNPLSGIIIEGPVLDPDFSSFVGLYPIPIRHGMTIGELCRLINTEFNLGAQIEVIKMKGWHRQFYHSDTELAWTVPSPNMPSFETALVYPGMCLLEGTNVSEGRGTTRPFEIFGAPWIDPFRLIRVLEKEGIAATVFRPTFFIPTFHKYKDQLCGGLEIYVQDIRKFQPVKTGLIIISTIKKLYPKKFQWRKPPYEFERKKLPFDILIGNAWVRAALENNASIAVIERRWQKNLHEFKKVRSKYLLYS